VRHPARCVAQLGSRIAPRDEGNRVDLVGRDRLCWIVVDEVDPVDGIEVDSDGRGHEHGGVSGWHPPTVDLPVNFGEGSSGVCEGRCTTLRYRRGEQASGFPHAAVLYELPMRSS